MITIEMLPAAHGDALWIEYGAGRQMRRILIDGGPARSYESGLRRRMAVLPEHLRNFELVVITHIDADHIDGAIILLQEKKPAGLKFQTKEFWFNGWAQLPKLETETYAPLQGEFLGGLLGKDSGLRGVWNKSFKKGAVMVSDQKPLPEIKLEGGALLTLLGPTASELKRLRARWVSAIRDFTPGDVTEALRRLKERRDYRPPTTPAVFAMPQYGSDRTPANGSSISFLLEYGGASVLLAGDAHASTLAASLGRLAAQRSVPRLRIDAVKLPHHGSMGNVSSEWLQQVDCQRWLISTNGAMFGHPDVETAQLISQHCQDDQRSKKPSFYCNYRSDTTLKLEGSSQWSVIFLKNGLLQLPSKASSTSKKTRKSSSPSRSSKKRRAPKRKTERR
jgi:beta-lactamase superfamily II metal-dependent hydrolase